MNYSAIRPYSTTHSPGFSSEINTLLSKAIPVVVSAQVKNNQDAIALFVQKQQEKNQKYEFWKLTSQEQSSPYGTPPRPKENDEYVYVHVRLKDM
jgi:hypothetical protein